MRNPFRYFNSSSEFIYLTVMMYVRYPLVGVQRAPASDDYAEVCGAWYAGPPWITQ